MVTVGVVITLAAGCSGAGQDAAAPLTAGTDAPVVVPRGPGEAPRTAKPGERLGDSGSRPGAADVTFAESMIPHHRQALEMAALVPARTRDPSVRALAERIAVAQTPEIRVMSDWLAMLGRQVPQGHAHLGGRYGMATLDQMNSLRAARDGRFDELFLRLMIAHHEGALLMARAELAEGTSRTMRLLAKEVAGGQSIEISRMKRLMDA